MNFGKLEVIENELDHIKIDVLVFIFMLNLLLSGQRPADNAVAKVNRHSCLQRRCRPLHAQMSFR
ncbi:apelin receptor early endogenous ligand [Echinops telfairi]|uniref:Apelin receptor early endogenous ligand n=1 Tax=Echinops telfairi TaxID=9371 RepID=A0ABM0ZR52_ECHTE|nr:apelin receptor early endogenous ligand [Echinops telfairi]